MNEETMELLIEMMAEKIKTLQADLEWESHVRKQFMDRTIELREEIEKLKRTNKPKRGRPAKKRGPGRPKKVKK